MIYGRIITVNRNLDVRSGPSVGNKIVGWFTPQTSIQIKSVVTLPGGWVWAMMDYWIGPKKTDYMTAYSIIQEPGVSVKYIEVYYSDTVQKPSDQGAGSKDIAKNPDPLLNNQGNLDINFGAGNSSGIVGDDYSNGSSVAREDSKLGIIGKDNDSYLATAESVRRRSQSMGINYSNEPKYVQNASAYPRCLGYNNGKNMYEYDYQTSYASYDNKLKDIRAMLDIPTRYSSNDSLFSTMHDRYNRFKLAHTSNELIKSHAHVFFTRPDLNILDPVMSNMTLHPKLQNDSIYYYAAKHSPEVLLSLVHNNKQDHDFMLSLSNRARSFSVSDEYIKTDTYGDSWLGYKMPYGKHDVESRAAGTIDMTFIDDRELHMYQLHKIWIDYINKVYRGRISAKEKYVLDKIIDYACSLYYIVTAENGEDIIFWSKYYGIFPTNAPSSAMSWADGTPLSRPSISISYSYAWKRDYDPLTLVEFNKHTIPNYGGKYAYLKTYDPHTLMSGQTMVGPPFIESVINKNLNRGGNPYLFKLRFMPN